MKKRTKTNAPSRNEKKFSKKGIPIAKIIPAKKSATASRLGSLKGLAEIKGDIVNCDTSDDWEALRCRLLHDRRDQPLS